MKFKKALTPSELAAQLAEQTPDADEQTRSREVEKRCEALKERGLLIEQWSLDDTEADLQWCGRDGSPTKVHRIQSIVLSGGEYREFPATEQGINELVGELIEEHTIG